MTHQNEGKKPYECDICGKVFHTKEHLDEHVKIHDVIKDANEDSKDQTNEIKQHDEKNHSCPHCDLKFSLIYTLENHIDNEHKVDENLNVEEDLKTHIETVHIEEKPSDCKPKKTIESPLINGVLVEKELNLKKLYTCKCCNQTFNSAKVQKIHTKKCKGNELFEKSKDTRN